MTWGLLGGIVALSGWQAALVWLIDSHWPEMGEAMRRTYVEGLLRQLAWMTGLQGMLAAGMVLIARGGSMKMSVSRDGATIEAEAEGGAARDLAKETTI